MPFKITLYNYTLGLRDDIIANVLSVGSEGSACDHGTGTPSSFATSADNTTANPINTTTEDEDEDEDGDDACRGARSREFPFSPVSVCVALAITLVTMVIACDLSLPAGGDVRADTPLTCI